MDHIASFLKSYNLKCMCMNYISQNFEDLKGYWEASSPQFRPFYDLLCIVTKEWLPTAYSEGLSTSPKGNKYSYANELDIEAAINAKFVDGEQRPLDPDYVKWEASKRDDKDFAVVAELWIHVKANSNLKFAALSRDAQLIIAREAIYETEGYAQDGNGIISSVHPQTGIRRYIPDNTGFGLKRDSIDFKYLKYELERTLHEASLKGSYLQDDPLSQFPPFHYVHESSDYKPFRFPEKPAEYVKPDYLLKIEGIELMISMDPEDKHGLHRGLKAIIEVIKYFHAPDVYLEEDQNGILVGHHPITGEIVYGRHTAVMYPPVLPDSSHLTLPPKPPYGELHPNPLHVEMQEVLLTYEKMVPGSKTLPLFSSHDDTESGYDGEYIAGCYGGRYGHDQPGIHTLDRIANRLDDISADSSPTITNMAALMYLITGNVRYLNDLLPSDDHIEALEDGLEVAMRLWGTAQDEQATRPFSALAADLHELNTILSLLLNTTFEHVPGYEYIPIQDMLSRHDETSAALKRVLRLLVIAYKNDNYNENDLHVVAYYGLVHIYAVELNLTCAPDIHLDTFYSRHTKDYTQPYFEVPLIDVRKLLSIMLMSMEEADAARLKALDEEYEKLVVEFLDNKKLSDDELFELRCSIMEIVPKLGEYCSNVWKKFKKN